MDRSLRQLGQLLVVMATLLGAVLGVALALLVENTDSPRPVAAAGHGGAAALAAPPSSSQPPASRAASSEGQADGRGFSGSQRAGPADRTDHGGGAADKRGEGRRDKPSRGNDKPSKGKAKNK